jgi:hypothetical protein
MRNVIGKNKSEKISLIRRYEYEKYNLLVFEPNDPTYSFIFHKPGFMSLTFDYVG